MYLNGISTGIDLSIAGILASAELIVSVIIGWTLLGENFSIVKAIGVLFMVVSAIISIKKPNNKFEEDNDNISSGNKIKLHTAN